MLTINAMNRRQSFVWLWRNDPEAKWLWFRCFLTGNNLKGDVLTNIETFGIFPKEITYEKTKMNYEEEAKKQITHTSAMSTVEIGKMADKEVAALRWMLCNCYSKQPYLDDGEMQDNSASPYIDFKRDSIKEIKNKILERNLIKLNGKD